MAARPGWVRRSKGHTVHPRGEHRLQWRVSLLAAGAAILGSALGSAVTAYTTVEASRNQSAAEDERARDAERRVLYAQLLKSLNAYAAEAEDISDGSVVWSLQEDPHYSPPVAPELVTAGSAVREALPDVTFIASPSVIPSLEAINEATRDVEGSVGGWTPIPEPSPRLPSYDAYASKTWVYQAPDALVVAVEGLLVAREAFTKAARTDLGVDDP